MALRSLFALAGLLTTLTVLAEPAREHLFARYADERATLWHLDKGTTEPLPTGFQTPLGSVWKLFIYAYLDDKRIDSADYACSGKSKEEVYCCQPGHRIDRERALVQSCGLYFEPSRLGLRKADWQAYWQARQAPAWLSDLRALKPDTVVPVEQLLAALNQLPERARRDASETLISVFTLGRGEHSLPDYGSRLRVKTWTMPDPQHPGAAMGGAAGWAADGSPVWLGGPGGSERVLSDAAPQLAPLLDMIAVADDGGCVQLHYFSRYPIKNFYRLPGRQAVTENPLRGRYGVDFSNGQHIEIESHGDMRLGDAGGIPSLSARLGVNEYIARVIDREAAPEPREAARALAVVIRSYLVQNAGRAQGCYAIEDSSATQRVAPRPASRAARAAADWSDSLILDGVPAQFHRDLSTPNRLGWQPAVVAAQSGQRVDAILAHSFVGAGLTSYLAPLDGDCQPLYTAEHWLADASQRWDRRLANEVGYERPPLPAVCALDVGRPRAEGDRQRIYAGLPISQEARITLAHEYLHLAFGQHPRGQDEVFVETMARQLIMGDTP